MGMSTKDDDFVARLYIASAHSYILVFTERGQVHWLKVHQIPELEPAARGKAIVNLLNLAPSEKVATTVAVRISSTTAISSSSPSRARSRRPSSRRSPTRGDAASSPSASRRATACSTSASPTAAGTWCWRRARARHPLPRGRRAADGSPRLRRARHPARERRPGGGDGGARRQGEVLTVASRGYGKRTAIADYREQGRGGKGIINLKVSAKTGEVVGVLEVTPTTSF